jgi:hypothetical protein
MSERKVDWFGRKDWGELYEAYKTLGKAAGFKVGDKVRVLRRADAFELGWTNHWHSSKTMFVGKVGEIDYIHSDGDIHVIMDGVQRYFPWFVLERVSEKHTITIDGKSVEVSEEAYNEIKRLFN